MDASAPRRENLFRPLHVAGGALAIIVAFVVLAPNAAADPSVVPTPTALPVLQFCDPSDSATLNCDAESEWTMYSGAATQVIKTGWKVRTTVSFTVSGTCTVGTPRLTDNATGPTPAHRDVVRWNTNPLVGGTTPVQTEITVAEDPVGSGIWKGTSSAQTFSHANVDKDTHTDIHAQVACFQGSDVIPNSAVSGTGRTPRAPFDSKDPAPAIDAFPRSNTRPAVVGIGGTIKIYVNSTERANEYAGGSLSVRSTTLNIPSTSVSRNGTITFTVPAPGGAVQAGNNHQFEVIAVDSAGRTATLGPATALATADNQVPPAGSTTLSAVSQTAATLATAAQLSVSWTTSNTGADAGGIALYASDQNVACGQTTPWVKVKTIVGASPHSFNPLDASIPAAARALFDASSAASTPIYLCAAAVDTAANEATSVTGSTVRTLSKWDKPPTLAWATPAIPGAGGAITVPLGFDAAPTITLTDDQTNTPGGTATRVTSFTFKHKAASNWWKGTVTDAANRVTSTDQQATSIDIKAVTPVPSWTPASAKTLTLSLPIFTNKAFTNAIEDEWTVRIEAVDDFGNAVAVTQDVTFTYPAPTGAITAPTFARPPTAGDDALGTISGTATGAFLVDGAFNPNSCAKAVCVALKLVGTGYYDGTGTSTTDFASATPVYHPVTSMTPASTSGASATVNWELTEWATRALPTGVYEVTVRVANANGASSGALPATPHQVTLDNTAPSITGAPWIQAESTVDNRTVRQGLDRVRVHVNLTGETGATASGMGKMKFWLIDGTDDTDVPAFAPGRVLWECVFDGAPASVTGDRCGATISGTNTVFTYGQKTDTLTAGQYLVFKVPLVGPMAKTYMNSDPYRMKVKAAPLDAQLNQGTAAASSIKITFQPRVLFNVNLTTTPGGTNNNDCAFTTGPCFARVGPSNVPFLRQETIDGQQKWVVTVNTVYAAWNNSTQRFSRTYQDFRLEADSTCPQSACAPQWVDFTVSLKNAQGLDNFSIQLSRTAVEPITIDGLKYYVYQPSNNQFILNPPPGQTLSADKVWFNVVGNAREGRHITRDFVYAEKDWKRLPTAFSPESVRVSHWPASTAARSIRGLNWPATEWFANHTDVAAKQGVVKLHLDYKVPGLTAGTDPIPHVAYRIERISDGAYFGANVTASERSTNTHETWTWVKGFTHNASGSAKQPYFHNMTLQDAAAAVNGVGVRPLPPGEYKVRVVECRVPSGVPASEQPTSGCFYGNEQRIDGEIVRYFSVQTSAPTMTFPPATACLRAAGLTGACPAAQKSMSDIFPRGVNLYVKPTFNLTTWVNASFTNISRGLQPDWFTATALNLPTGQRTYTTGPPDSTDPNKMGFNVTVVGTPNVNNLTGTSWYNFSVKLPRDARDGIAYQLKLKIPTESARFGAPASFASIAHEKPLYVDLAAPFATLYSNGTKVSTAPGVTTNLWDNAQARIRFLNGTVTDTGSGTTAVEIRVYDPVVNRTWLNQWPGVVGNVDTATTWIPANLLAPTGTAQTTRVWEIRPGTGLPQRDGILNGLRPDRIYWLYVRTHDQANQTQTTRFFMGFDNEIPTYGPPVAGAFSSVPDTFSAKPNVKYGDSISYKVRVTDDFGVANATLKVTSPSGKVANYSMFVQGGACIDAGGFRPKYDANYLAPAASAFARCTKGVNITTGTAPFTFWRNLTEAQLPELGEYKVELTVSDYLKNKAPWTGSLGRFVVVDNGAPFLHVRAVPPLACLGCEVRLEADVFDPVGVRDVRLQLTNETAWIGSWAMTAPAATNKSGVWTWKNTDHNLQLKAGAYFWTVVANDTAAGPWISGSPNGDAHRTVNQNYFRVSATAAPVVSLLEPIVEGGYLPATATVKLEVKSNAIAPANLVVKTGNSTANLTTATTGVVKTIMKRQGTLVGYEVTVTKTLASSQPFLVNVTATDNASAVVQKQFAFKVDIAPPTVTASISPAPLVVGGVNYGKGGARIVVNATDDVTTSPTIQYRVNGAAATNATGREIPFPAAGQYTVQVWAVDGAGNAAPTKTFTLTVDLTGPTVTRVSAGQEIVVRASDAGVGVDAGNVTLHWRLAAGDTFTATKMLADAAGDTFTARVPQNVTNALQFYVTALDKLGNAGGYKSASDPDGIGAPPPPTNRAPTLVVTSPAPGSEISGNVKILWGATDADGDVIRVTITARSDANSTYDIAEAIENLGQADWDTSELPDGAYTIVVVAEDDNGANAQRSVSVRVVQPTLVVLPIESPEDVVEEGDAVEFSVNVTPPPGRTIGAVVARILKDGAEFGEPVPMTFGADGAYSASYTPSAAGEYEIRVAVTYDDGKTEVAEGVSEFTVEAKKTDVVEPGFAWTSLPFGFAAVAALAVIAVAAFGAFGRRGGP